MASQPAKQPSKRVTEARAAAQRAKLDAQAQRRHEAAAQQAADPPAKKTQGKQKQASLLAKRRASTSIERAIADYLLDHEGGNSSQKTLQWHQTALGLLRSFLAEERGTTLVGEVDAPGSLGRIDHQRLVGREETFKGQVQQPFLETFTILGFMRRVTHRQTYPDILLSRMYRGDSIAPSPTQKRSNPLDIGLEQVVPLLRGTAGRIRPEHGLWHYTMCSV